MIGKAACVNVLKYNNMLKKEYRRIPWNKGLTKETDERVKKNGIATSKGRIRNNTKHSDEHKMKISEATKNSHKNNKRINVYKKISESLKGHPVSLETREKISKTLSPYGRDLKNRIRDIPEYIKWRTDIFIRDDRKCVKCGNKKDIIVHHIKSLREILIKYNITTLKQALNCKELWDLNNGQTLCNDCHEQTENYGSKSFKKGCLVKAIKI